MWPDFSLLDRPHILAFLFYPRPDWSPPPEGAEDLTIPVADGVSLSARLYTADRDWPVILFFHGNGEVVADYDAIAPLYHGSGLNLLVVDYRGYGRSGGRPTVAALHADAHRVKAAAFAHLDANGY
ncbi:MAG: alpha/beta hydrolase, partial [Chloroflexota bacterium]